MQSHLHALLPARVPTAVAHAAEIHLHAMAQAHTPLEEALMERAQQTVALRTENVMLRSKINNIEARSLPPAQDAPVELHTARKVPAGLHCGPAWPHVVQHSSLAI